MVEVQTNKNRQFDTFLVEAGKRNSLEARFRNPSKFDFQGNMAYEEGLSAPPKAYLQYKQRVIDSSSIVALVTKVPDFSPNASMNDDATNTLEVYVLSQEHESAIMSICKEFEDLFDGHAVLVQFYAPAPVRNPLKNE